MMRISRHHLRVSCAIYNSFTIHYIIKIIVVRIHIFNRAVVVLINTRFFERLIYSSVSVLCHEAAIQDQDAESESQDSDIAIHF